MNKAESYNINYFGDYFSISQTKITINMGETVELDIYMQKNGEKYEKNNKKIQTIFNNDIVDGNAYCRTAYDGICGISGGNG